MSRCERSSLEPSSADERPYQNHNKNQREDVAAVPPTPASPTVAIVARCPEYEQDNDDDEKHMRLVVVFAELIGRARAQASGPSQADRRTAPMRLSCGSVALGANEIASKIPSIPLIPHGGPRELVPSRRC